MNAETQKTRAVVVGAGVFGVWTAYHLQKTGRYDVTVIDAWGAGNSRSSSGGESRIIRASYGPDEVYSRMASDSLAQWRALLGTAQPPLFHEIGVLWLYRPGNVYAAQSRDVLHKLGYPFEDLSARDLRKRYPQIHYLPDTVAIFEPHSGALMARRCAMAVLAAFEAAGGRFVRARVNTPPGHGRLASVKTAAGETIAADVFVFACGPWLPKVFPDLLGHRIFPTRQSVAFVGTPAGDANFAPPRMPVWIDFSDDRGMYGFPDLDNRGFKLAFDKHGPAIDPDTLDRVIPVDKITEARRYLADRFPALAHAPINESRVCQYENTSNGDFLLDRHPEFENVWLTGGGSGHGFKHGPAVGEYMAARITGASSPAVEPRFSLASKATTQSRAVY